MATKNDITGDTIATKNNTDAYREGYDRIFGKGAHRAEVDRLNKIAEASCQPLHPGETVTIYKLNDDEETE